MTKQTELNLGNFAYCYEQTGSNQEVFLGVRKSIS